MNDPSLNPTLQSVACHWAVALLSLPYRHYSGCYLYGPCLGSSSSCKPSRTRVASYSNQLSVTGWCTSIFSSLSPRALKLWNTLLFWSTILLSLKAQSINWLLDLRSTREICILRWLFIEALLQILYSILCVINSFETPFRSVILYIRYTEQEMSWRPHRAVPNSVWAAGQNNVNTQTMNLTHKRRCLGRIWNSPYVWWHFQKRPFLLFRNVPIFRHDSEGT